VSLLVAGLSNTNSLITDTPAACIVIVYRCINVLGKGLHRVLYEVLYNARPPNIAGWC
jgi:hypothetical protein